jgi:ferredoxin-nitrite reductase
MRIPGGILNVAQCRAIADLVDRYSTGYLQVTNRANLQIRNLNSAISAEVWQNLQELGLASRCVEIDPIRNIMTSPTAGIDRQQLLDTRPLVKAWDDYLQSHPELSELSAKFSVGFDGGESVAIGTLRNDILLAAERRSTDLDIVFRLHLNGDTGIVIQESQCISVLAALTSVYLEYTKNQPRIEGKKPRLRHLLADWGVEKYLEQAQHNLPFLLQLTSCTVKNRQDACSTKHELDCGVGILPAHQNRQDACSTKSELDCGVGILPAHQNRQDACSTKHELDCGVGILPAHQNRQDACSTKSELDCGVGILPAHSISEKSLANYQHLGIHPQQQSGFSYIGIVLPLGRLKSQQLRELANLAQNFGRGILRLTPWQNLLISDIPNHRLDELEKSIARLELHSSATNLDSCLVACAGSSGCSSAKTDTQSDALTMVRDLKQKLQIDRPINIHFSGCEKSCAQHSPIDITLVGIQIKQGNQTIAGYDIYAGKTDSPFGRPIFRAVRVAEISSSMNKLLQIYQRWREPSESFGEFVDKCAIDKLQHWLNS